MTSTIRALQGDTFDLICWRELGTTEGGVVEAAIALNRALAEAGPVIAEGASVILPDPPAAATATLETVNLWD